MSTDAQNRPDTSSESDAGNPIQQEYDNKFNGATSPREIAQGEVNQGSTSSSSANNPTGSSKSDLKQAESGAGAIGGIAGAVSGGGLKNIALKVVGGGKKKGLIGGGGVIALVGVIMFIGSILQGPMEFLQAGSLLSGFHFGAQDDFSDYRTTRHLAYTLAGKSAQGRLTKGWNKHANTWEKRLNKDSGLRSIYSDRTQRLIGYQVIDKDLAKNYIKDMERSGIPQTNRMTGVDINGTRFSATGTIIDLRDKKFRDRRAVTRTAVKSVGLNRIASSLGSRLLIKRAGVDFHPLKNVVRDKADDYAKWKQEQLDKKAASLENGPNGSGSPLRAKMLELAEKLKGFIDKAKGPVVAIGVVCALKSFDEQVDAQNLANQLQLMRLGMDTPITADQVRYGNGSFNLEELGVLHENFYDKKTQTHFFDDPGIKYESGQSPSGKDYAAGVKPDSTGLPGVLQLVANIPMGIGPLNACEALDSLGDLWGVRQLSDAASFAIDAILKPFGLSQKELFDMAVNYFASGGVDMAAKGALRGGEANIGTRLAANNQFLAMGGRKLTAAEASEVKAQATKVAAENFSQENIFNRYLNLTDAKSMASTVYLRSPKSARQLASSVMSLPASIANLSLSGFGGGTVGAAKTYNYGFPLIGFSTEEIHDDTYDNPYANEDYMLEGDRLEQMNAEYGIDCFDMTISRDGTLDYGESKDFHKIPDKCNDKDNVELTHYRYYHADMIVGLGLYCYEGDEDACAQLGMGQTGTASASSAVIATYNGLHAVSFPDGKCHPDTEPMRFVAKYNASFRPDCVDRRTSQQSKIILGQAPASNPQFDIVGMQEVSQPLQDALRSKLPGYDSFPDLVPRNHGVAVFWNTAKFTKTGDGTVHLINNIAEPADLPWVELQSGEMKFVVLSIHAPNDGHGGGPIVRQNMADDIQRWAQRKAGPKTSVLLMGDFNEQLGGLGGMYCTLTRDPTLQNGIDLAKHSDAANQCPSRGQNKGIDHVYVSPVADITGQGWRHLPEAGIYNTASDHTPAFVQINFGTVAAGNTSGTACGAGDDLGTADGYKDGKRVIIRICKVQGIVVNSKISSNVDKLLNDARAAGIPMSGGGFRTMQEQTDLYNHNCPGGVCNVQTAKPGFSNHQMGLAIDFTYNGAVICFPQASANCSGNRGFDWLKSNASKYGLQNFPRESWHWSVDGT